MKTRVNKLMESPFAGEIISKPLSFLLRLHKATFRMSSAFSGGVYE